MFGKDLQKTGRADSLIGAGSRVEGDIHFCGGLRVEGCVVGNISALDKDCTLVLAENGSVEGEIDVPHVVIDGRVQGPVRALEYLELQAKSRVTGDVHYKAIEMRVGAVVEGRLVYADARQENIVELKPAAGV